VIDGHRHVLCKDAQKMALRLDPIKATDYLDGAQEASAEINRKKAPAWNRKMTDIEEHFADMVGSGIDMGVLWPPPVGFYYWAEPLAGAELTRLINENVCRIISKKPGRFLGLAAVPLQDTDLAVRELPHAVRDLGLHGVAIASNVNGHTLDEEQFHPFFEEAENLDVPIFIHPHNAVGSERMRNYYLINFLGYPMDSTLAAVQLLFGGVLDRFPGLKICLAHGGGVLPFLLGRLEHGQSVRPEARELCAHPVSYYLRHFYMDSITFRPETLRFVLSMVPEGHVFMGTDYPFDMGDLDAVQSVKSAVTDETLLKQILSGTLRQIMGLSGADDLDKK
jgi:aminocarboxymuconate-semialdehyde decarboxylase